MRIILVNPSQAGKGNIPVNLPLLNAVLKNAGHVVRIFDFSDYQCFQPQFLYKSKSMNSGKSPCGEVQAGKWVNPGLYFKKAEDIDLRELTALRIRYSKNVQNTQSPYREDREILKQTDPGTDFADLCRSFRPDVVGVSSLTVDYPFAVEFTARFKKEFGYHLLFGGIHSIILPEHAISSSAVDSICIGEGERAFPLFLDRYEKGGEYWKTPNMWVKNNGVIERNPIEFLSDMDELPILDFDGFDPVHFFRPFNGKLYRMLNYEWGRGCPYSCSYCANAVIKSIYKHLRPEAVRHKPVQESIAELEHLVNKYEFDFIRFWDEDFTAASEAKLIDYSKEYQRSIKLPFIIYARTESISVRKIEILKEMGCVTFAIGIESGSELIRRAILNRQLSNRAILDTFNKISAAGIRVSSYNIIGFPQENRSRIFETIKLNRAASISSSSCTLLEAYPGTPIRTMCESEGMDPVAYPNYDSFFGIAQFVSKGMSLNELNGLYKTFTLYVHLPRYLFPLIERAEKDDEEGVKMYEILTQLKAQCFMDKPVYDDEDDYQSNETTGSIKHLPRELPDRKQAALALLKASLIKQL